MKDKVRLFRLQYDYMGLLSEIAFLGPTQSAVFSIKNPIRHPLDAGARRNPKNWEARGSSASISTIVRRRHLLEAVLNRPGIIDPRL